MENAVRAYPHRVPRPDRATQPSRQPNPPLPFREHLLYHQFAVNLPERTRVIQVWSGRNSNDRIELRVCIKSA
jgi:hypothetical protein